MLRFTTSLMVAALSILLTAPTPTTVRAEELTVAAGTKGGPNYSFGRVLCRLLARKAKDTQCTLLPTKAGDANDSFANLSNVRNGAADFGIARSDWQYFAYAHTGPVKHMLSKFDMIRSLFTIHYLPVTLLARRDAGVASLKDLRSKRVNLGVQQSDIRAGMETVLAAAGLKKSDLGVTDQLTLFEQSLAFCHDRVQVMANVGSHPNDDVRRVISLCDAAIIPVSGGKVDGYLKENPWLAGMTVPSGVYPGVAQPVQTIGRTITVVTSTDVAEDDAYRLVKAVFDNLPDLKKMLGAPDGLEAKKMMRDGLSAPLHKGAERYFKEQGLM